MGIFLDIGKKQKYCEDYCRETLTWHLGNKICRVGRHVKNYFWSLEKIQPKIRNRHRSQCDLIFLRHLARESVSFWHNFQTHVMSLGWSRWHRPRPSHLIAVSVITSEDLRLYFGHFLILCFSSFPPVQGERLHVKHQRRSVFGNSEMGITKNYFLSKLGHFAFRFFPSRKCPDEVHFILDVSEKLCGVWGQGQWALWKSNQVFTNFLEKFLKEWEKIR